VNATTQPEKRLSPHGDLITYELTRLGTGLGVGWFSCIPKTDFDFETALKYGQKHPNDQFMHKYLLDLAANLEPSEMELLIERGHNGNLHLLALMWETCLLHDKFGFLKSKFSEFDIAPLEGYSPLIYTRCSLKNFSDYRFYWLKCFAENINMHKPMPFSKEFEAPIPFGEEEIEQWKSNVLALKEQIPSRIDRALPPDKTVIKRAAKEIKKKLERLGILEGWEARTQATLSPYAIERPWRLDIKVDEGRNRWRLTGTQTSFGRGLDINHARISCYMEVVERYSAFGNMGGGRALGYRNEHCFIKDRYQNLVKKGFPALDPNEMCLEVPYQNQELYWIEGERIDEQGSSTIYVPVQFVFLFPNLDEISLTTGLPSTGLGAGSSIAQAKVSGLLEVIERDAEKVVPYSGDKGFILRSEHPDIIDIIEGNKQRGIYIQFLDITSEFGIPCYRAFVQGPGGVILKGSAASLDAGHAAVAAMTEIPYPYPYWFGSMQAPEGLKVLQYEELPNFSSGIAEKDKSVIENVLIANGYKPIYVDLMREDINIPVIKALVPGLEMTTVFDRYSPIGFRQFAHYLTSS